MADVEYKRLWMRVRQTGENPVLKNREMMFDPVAHEIRIGDGTTVFEDLVDIIHTDLNWYPEPDPMLALRKAIANGTASTTYPIGTQVVTKYTDPANSTEYDLPWNIVSYRKVTTQDGVEHDAAIIQAHYAIPSLGIQFDAPEPSNTDSDRKTSGSNRYSQSAIRQWLNSSAAAGSWWTAQSNTDVKPPYADTLPGLLACLPKAFVDRLKPVKVTTVTANVDSNTIDTTYDKLWLPSTEEVYTATDDAKVNGKEGPYWEYWKTRIGTSSPITHTDSTNMPKRIVYSIEDATKPIHYWLRSVRVSTSFRICYVFSNGRVYYDYAESSQNPDIGNAVRTTPACAIF